MSGALTDAWLRSEDAAQRLLWHLSAAPTDLAAYNEQAGKLFAECDAAKAHYSRLIGEASDAELWDHDFDEAKAELRRRLSISAQAPSRP